MIKVAYDAAQRLNTFMPVPRGPVLLCQIWRLAERVGLTLLADCSTLSACFYFVKQEGKLAALAPIGLREFALGICRIATLVPGQSLTFAAKLKRVCGVRVCPFSSARPCMRRALMCCS